jgi:prepilin-type processing-associated H-X9-DG protein
MSARLKKLLQAFGCLFIPLAFLVAAFYPMFADIQENARTTACHSNLKKLGTALSMYAQDNNDALPNVSNRDGSNTWREEIFPYVQAKDAYHCPDRAEAADSSGFSQNYAANACRQGAFAVPGSPPMTRTAYLHPAKLILLLEAENNPRPDFDIDDPVLFGSQTQKLWAGHFSVHGNFLMADGHVKLYGPSGTYLYDPKNHSLFNFWYRNTDTRLSANGEEVLKVAERHFHWGSNL